MKNISGHWQAIGGLIFSIVAFIAINKFSAPLSVLLAPIPLIVGLVLSYRANKNSDISSD